MGTSSPVCGDYDKMRRPEVRYQRDNCHSSKWGILGLSYRTVLRDIHISMRTGVYFCVFTETLETFIRELESEISARFGSHTCHGQWMIL